MEISFAFFTRCPTIFPELGQVRAAVEDLWVRRVEKIRRTLCEANSETLDHFSLENATRMELHYFREPIVGIRQLLTSLNAVGKQQRMDDLDD
jgi:hypothetical protein